MKKLAAVCSVIFVLVMLCACSQAEDNKSMSYSRDHEEEVNIKTSVVGVVKDYERLRLSLCNIIKNAQTSSSIIIENYEGELEWDLEQLTDYLLAKYPLGSFCVESIMYNTNYIGSYCELDVFITYGKSHEDIESAVEVYALSDFGHRIREMIKNNSTKGVFICKDLGLSEDEVYEVFYREWANSGYNSCGVKDISITAYPSFNSSQYVIEADISYTLTGREAARIAEACLNVSAETANDCASGKTQEKLLFVFDWLIKNVDYDYVLSRAAAEENGTQPKTEVYCAAGAFLLGKAAQSGIAQAASVLLSELDVENKVIVGTKDGQLYYWIYMEVNGARIHFDPCQGFGNTFDACILNEEALENYSWNKKLY